MRFINMALIKEPMNWAMVWLIASVWLIVIHSLMQGFTAMQASPGVPAAPGQAQALPATLAPPPTAAPSLAVTSPTLASGLILPPASSGLWTDGREANYAEDGWIP